MRRVVHVNNLKRGMLLWAKVPFDSNGSSYWTRSWGGLIEATVVIPHYHGSVDAQILNGGHYHGEIANYALDELWYLD